MKEDSVWHVGMDVHAKTIAVAVAEPDGTVRSVGSCYRAGDLTAVWVPDAAHEALRDLVRAREAAKKDQLKARHRLGKFSAAVWPASG